MNPVPPVRGPQIPRTSQDVPFNPADVDSTIDLVTQELTSVVTLHVSARIRLYLRACDTADATGFILILIVKADLKEASDQNGRHA